ncbi:hypothetical protein MKZ38_007453 [Zalerion maritima]|uniref:Uncharacterized protein n=1 Tax=Zalerion maritima TaxID=339359 RepID=A0AAD5WPS2_9PEZI|nr:hypothetical protein MKZ38_007453 [Zalerion maritima]
MSTQPKSVSASVSPTIRLVRPSLCLSLSRSSSTNLCINSISLHHGDEEYDDDFPDLTRRPRGQSQPDPSLPLAERRLLDLSSADRWTRILLLTVGPSHNPLFRDSLSSSALPHWPRRSTSATSLRTKHFSLKKRHRRSGPGLRDKFLNEYVGKLVVRHFPVPYRAVIMRGVKKVAHPVSTLLGLESDESGESDVDIKVDALPAHSRSDGNWSFGFSRSPQSAEETTLLESLSPKGRKNEGLFKQVVVAIETSSVYSITGKKRKATSFLELAWINLMHAGGVFNEGGDEEILSLLAFPDPVPTPIPTMTPPRNHSPVSPSLSPHLPCSHSQSSREETTGLATNITSNIHPTLPPSHTTQPKFQIQPRVSNQTGLHPSEPDHEISSGRSTVSYLIALLKREILERIRWLLLEDLHRACREGGGAMEVGLRFSGVGRLGRKGLREEDIFVGDKNGVWTALDKFVERKGLPKLEVEQ